MHSETSDESGDERTSADEDVTPNKDTGRRNKKTTNGTKETGAGAPAGTLIPSFRAWTWGMKASSYRHPNHTHSTRTRVYLHGCCLDFPAGHPRWGYSLEA
jgi:hypothetical protein